MVRSEMPVQSFLFVFGALLILFPELLLGTTPGLSTVDVNDPGVQRALSFMVRQYNQHRSDSINYYKVHQVQEAKEKVVNGKLSEIHVTGTMLKTICQKQNRALKFKNIQKCLPVPGAQQLRNFYFVLDVTQEH